MCKLIKIGTAEHPAKLNPTIMSAVPRKTELAWQMLTEQHTVTVKDFAGKGNPRYLGAVDRWIFFPEDRSISFPVETFAPKVQLQHNVGPKCLPRNVEMERRRRIYRNLHVRDTLSQEGILSRNILPPDVVQSFFSHEEKYGLYATVHFLPLEIFDDESFDCRTEDDWIKLGYVDGLRHPLPATVFVEKRVAGSSSLLKTHNDVDNLFDWHYAAVTDYDYNRKLWSIVTLDGHQRKFQLSRIRVRFFAEDPRVFAKRVAAAVEARNRAEGCIRYNFYLDCMQVEGIQSFSADDKNALTISALRNGRQTFTENKINDIITEIELDYKRSMCDIEWHKLMETCPNIFAFVTWKPENQFSEETQVKYLESSNIRGKIITEMNDFEDTRNLLHWRTIYVYPQVYEACMCIVDACLKVSSMNLFLSNYDNAMSLDEFQARQCQKTSDVIKYLREEWLHWIVESIRMSLKKVGKGWFNLDQKIPQLYDVTKLKRFINLKIMLMQNALRNLVESSTSHYQKVLEAPALCTFEAEDSFSWGDDLVNTQFHPSSHPVFQVELKMNEDGPYYSDEPKHFEQVIITLFDDALLQCHKIRQAHPLFLTDLKFPKDLYLSSVGLLEKSVCDVRERLIVAYKKSIVPLIAYANEYKKYLNFHTIDVIEYIQNLKNEKLSAMELKDEISHHIRMRNNLEATLPKTITIGPFIVNVNSLREYLIIKRNSIANQVLVMLTEMLREQVGRVLMNYAEIEHKLDQQPQSIEEIFEIRLWMDTIPFIVKNLDNTMQKIKLEFDILDAFWCVLSDEDFQAKWEAISYPYQIDEQIRNTNAHLEEEVDKFFKLQIVDEANFLDKIDMLAGNVASIALQTDVGSVHEISADVSRIWHSMTECRERGVLLNERQTLFGVPVTPFDHLAKLMSTFEPYKTLWTTASDWLRWHDLWMESPLINIDGNQIEELLNSIDESMSRCAKIFQEHPRIAAIALATRDQIESFKPYVGLMQSLRNPGMMPRHFEELSTRTGIQMSLDQDLNFKGLLVLGLMEFKDIIKEVADDAAKEYAIECTFGKMTSEWQTMKIEVVPYKDTGTYLMKISNEILMLLDEHINSMQKIRLDSFKTTFDDKIIEWEHKLILTREVITEWINVQKIWLYFEPIFASQDISRQLPVEAKKYNTMERNWRRIMKKAIEYPFVKFCMFYSRYTKITG